MKTWETAYGDLVLGDCLEHMAEMARKKQRVDFVLGSPPYEGQRLYLEDGEDPGIARDTAEWVLWMREVFKASLAITDGLVAFVVGHGKTEDFRWSGAPALLCADLIRKDKINLRDPKWFGRNGISGSGGPDDLRKDIEWIICATNGGRLEGANNKAMGGKPKYKPGGQLTHRMKDGKRVHMATGTRGSKDGDTLTVRTRRAVTDITNPGNLIWCSVGGGKMGSDKAHENEAPYPEPLAEFLIRTFCKPGGVVYDPFCGSFTTGAVAIKTGRRFLTCDLRRSQIKIALRRVNEVIAKGGEGLGV